MRYLMTGCLILWAVAAAGCAGRIANPVAAEAALDHNLSCKEIRAEVAANDDHINALNQESVGRQEYNKNYGNVPVLGFMPITLWPTGFFALDHTIMDQNERPQHAEGVAYAARSQHLLELAKKNGC
jgi:hypothetical protein